jgi:phage terminase large subunit
LSILKIPTAKVFKPLLLPARYKGAYGGRGSGKSHFFGELLVETCEAERGTLAVCIREAQRTLAQSSKRLIESKIAGLGLGHRFKVFSDKIETPGDGIIIFKGMQDHTADSIKSLEGFRVAWVDEAQNLSARSLALLRPTIRAEASQLWASWNRLQLRLMRALELRARHIGWRCVVSDTTNNLASANNFIRAGYRLYQPQYPWAWPNTLYWRKSIK